MSKTTMRTVWALMLVAGLAACDNSPEYITYIKKGEGPQVKSDQLLFTSMVVTDESDSTLFDSRMSPQPPRPIYYLDSLGELNKFDGALGLLKVGDSVKITLKATEYFDPAQGRGMPPTMDSTTVLTFTLGIDSVKDRVVYMEEQLQTQIAQRSMQMQMALMDSAMQAKIAAESAEIEAYMQENGLEATTTKNGVQVVITEQGTGEMPKPGQVLVMNYAGSLLDGTYFDTNDPELAQAEGIYSEGRPYQPFEFQLLTGSVILGWHIGMAELPVGSKATLLIPSPLAYGERGAGSGQIPPNAPLRFDVEVLEAKSPFEE